MIISNFAKIIAKIMHEKKLNQLQLSKILGIRQSQVSNWLSGKSLPSYYYLRKLCAELDLSADIVLELK